MQEMNWSYIKGKRFNPILLNGSLDPVIDSILNLHIFSFSYVPNAKIFLIHSWLTFHTYSLHELVTVLENSGLRHHGKR